MGNFEQDVKEVMRRGPDLDIADIPVVTNSDGKDIFDAVNTKLASLGPDQTVIISPDRYDKASGKAVSTQLSPDKPDQMVLAMGSDVQLADGSDVDPVRITENGFEIEQLNIEGNRDNNNINAAVSTDTGLSGIRLDNIEFEEVPTGLELNSLSDSIVTECRVDEDSSGIDTPFLLDQCNEMSFIGNSARSYATTGIELRRCDSILVRGIVATSESGEVAEQGLLLKGTTDSEVEGTLDMDGEVKEGVVSETFDPGGANQEVSGGNQIEMSVNGARDIALRVSDSESESIDVSIDGEYDGGKTTKAFDFDSPNGINTPKHIADINSTQTTRLTDTNETATNVGVILNLSLSQMTNTGSITLAGESIVTSSLGIGLPNPAIIIGQDTSANVRKTSTRSQTDGSGQVVLDWSNSFAFTDKPSIGVNLEQAGQFHISSYTTNANGEYTGATLQITDSGGTAVGAGVNVTARLLGT